MTECQTGVETCHCPDCPPLQTSDTTKVQSCSGAPNGAWLLSHFEVGRTTLNVNSGSGTVIGTCDAQMKSTAMTTPRALMDLQAGGTARYYSDAIPFSFAWSDSCVTSKVSALGCEQPLTRTNLYACKLDCDTCTCSSGLETFTDESGDWLRTEAKLTVSLWGKPIDFDYCLKDDVLSVSTPGVFATFKHVYPFSKPTACDKRTSDQCAMGPGCRRGGCVGASQCTTQFTEGTCLTLPGCSWDPNLCTGVAQGPCRIQDYGVVPGCDLGDRPKTCVGTPTPCADRDEMICAKDGQCTLSTADTCVGGPLNCGQFTACPIGYCTWISPTCYGGTSCEARKTADECNYVNTHYPNAPCTWKKVSTCSGTVKPCSSYTPEACESVSGCTLQDGP